MKLKYYVELKDLNNPEEWSNKIDIYGYDNEVWVLAMGFNKSYPLTDSTKMVECIDEIISKLEKANCVVINKEDVNAWLKCHETVVAFCPKLDGFFDKNGKLIASHYKIFT